MRKLITLLVLVFLASCPGFTNCPGTDPYATARAIISGAQMSVGMSDAVFMAWAATQSDPEKVKKALTVFTKIKVDVLDALKIAMDSVDIAQQAKVDPDINKIMDKAEVAFQDLRKFLSDILAKPAPTSLPKVTAPVKAEADELFQRLPKTLLRGGHK